MRIVYRSTPNSELWLEEFKRGYRTAFDTFFHSYYHPILFYAIKLVKDDTAAEDIVYESFIKIWERRHIFSHYGSLRPYLYTTVKNGSINWLKKQQRQFREDASYNYVQKELEKINFEAVISAEVFRQIYEAMETLPEECKKVMKLHFNEGKRIQEVAEILNISVSTVKTQKARGLAALRKKLPPTAYAVLLLLDLAHMLAST